MCIRDSGYKVHKIRKRYEMVITMLKSENDALKRMLETFEKGEARPQEFAARAAIVVHQVMDMIHVDRIEEVLPQIVDLISTHKYAIRIRETITAITIGGKSPGPAGELLTLKRCWKFIRNLMREYADLKRGVRGPNRSTAQ
eukprot:TRINITY_DN11660_c0_g2_i2.p1 TRINITY_DN11660_c0_g2~~TRINITY_DN11660_c0_g2_i2.p1  ORF type:complete len:162 (+),score=39.59 TRINITY_DN11660_c0_g2_i2:62-487(+)